MFCIIQEIPLKKPNKYGAHKKLRAYQFSSTIGDKPAGWHYERTGERFERPIQKA